jgi:hypothetical protein
MRDAEAGGNGNGDDKASSNGDGKASSNGDGSGSDSDSKHDTEAGSGVSREVSIRRRA